MMYRAAATVAVIFGNVDLAASSSLRRTLGEVEPDAMCIQMCEGMKCNERSKHICKDKARIAADIKKDYCELYGPSEPPLVHHVTHGETRAQHYCNSARQCKICEADCNEDRDCKGSLKCFHRDDTTPFDSGVPGCSGTPVSKLDYCYDPDRVDSDKDTCKDNLGTDAPTNCPMYSNCVRNYFLDTNIKTVTETIFKSCKYGEVDPPSGYSDTCDDILAERAGTADKKNIDKACSEFQNCVEDDIRSDNPQSTASAVLALLKDASDLQGKANIECSGIDKYNLADEIWSKYAYGQCDDYLGGWKETCKEYYDCHFTPLEMECDDCSTPCYGSYCEYRAEMCKPMEEWTIQCIDDSLFGIACDNECNPSPEPSAVPTPSPSSTPSALHSASPSASPSESPSASPSESPSASPSESPSASPSESPSASPSESPSASPSESPSASPSESPSSTPTSEPSSSPSSSPSESPTVTAE